MNSMCKGPEAAKSLERPVNQDRLAGLGQEGGPAWSYPSLGPRGGTERPVTARDVSRAAAGSLSLGRIGSSDPPLSSSVSPAPTPSHTRSVPSRQRPPRRTSRRMKSTGARRRRRRAPRETPASPTRQAGGQWAVGVRDVEVEGTSTPCRLGPEGALCRQLSPGWMQRRSLVRGCCLKTHVRQGHGMLRADCSRPAGSPEPGASRASVGAGGTWDRAA